MPRLNLTLKPDDDRVVNLEVTDQHGEIYRVNLEFLNHHFNQDEVQVRVTKPGGNGRNGTKYVLNPNSVVFKEEVVGHRRDGTNIYGAWFEFHEVDEYPRVKTIPWEDDNERT